MTSICEEDMAILNKITNLKNDIQIFVYVPPKVGSTSLVSSLRLSLGNNCSVNHIHDSIMLEVVCGIKNVNIIDLFEKLAILKKNVYVFDIYRTPVERKISEYFEKISPYHFNNTEEKINNYSTSKIIKRFNKLYPHLGKGDYYSEKYQLNEKLMMFDFNKNFIINEKNGVKYVKLRLQDFFKWNTILFEIFNKEIIVVKDHLTENKKISEIYKKFKNEYKLPTNYFLELKSDKYLNNYLNSYEINSYLANWESKQDSNFIPFSNDEYKMYEELCLDNQHIIDVQYDHYLDNGCYCSNCSIKREILKNKIKSGKTIEISDKILHVNPSKKILIPKLKNKNINESKYGTNKFKLLIK